VARSEQRDLGHGEKAVQEYQEGQEQHFHGVTFHHAPRRAIATSFRLQATSFRPQASSRPRYLACSSGRHALPSMTSRTNLLPR
jgi:hypothetical protein